MLKINTFGLAIALVIVAPLEAQNVITSADPIPLSPQQPSPWWQIDRLGSGLIESWSIQPTIKLIKFKINPEVWLISDYIRRYSIIQKLGSLARANNYDLAIEDSRERKLAEYIYDQDRWQIRPPYLGATPFGANMGRIFGFR